MTDTGQPIIVAPNPVAGREIEPRDILYTAWSRGHDGRFWFEDTEPLKDKLEELIKQRIGYEVQQALLAFNRSGILPPNSLPEMKMHDRIDLWVKNGSCSPTRLTDCSFSNGRWFAGFGERGHYLGSHETILGWAPIPEMKKA